MFGCTVMGRVWSPRSVRAAGFVVAAAAAALLTGCSGASKGEAFGSPQAGARALVDALRANDDARVREVLGGEGDAVINSGDEVADESLRTEFLAAFDRKHGVVEEGDGYAVLTVGDDDWPMPIPLVEDGDGWRFDTEAGKEEVLARRIGRNELFAIEVCRAIVDAQREYAAADPAGTGGRIYAERFLSGEGARDGLYWPTTEGEAPSPLGELIAGAEEEGYRRSDEPQPFHGYMYKMLKSQGPSAPGGAREYMNAGRMRNGFAVIAWPAEYDNSGIMTFMVSADGVVYEKDLGSRTGSAARGFESFNPDEGWRVVR